MPRSLSTYDAVLLREVERRAGRQVSLRQLERWRSWGYVARASERPRRVRGWQPGLTVNEAEVTGLGEVADLFNRFGRRGRWWITLILVARGRELPDSEVRAAYEQLARQVDAYGYVRGGRPVRRRELGRKMRRDLVAYGHEHDLEALTFDSARQRRNPVPSVDALLEARRARLPSATELVASASDASLVRALRLAYTHVGADAALTIHAKGGPPYEDAVPLHALDMIALLENAVPMKRGPYKKRSAQ